MVEYYVLETENGWLFKKPGFIQPIKTFQTRKEVQDYVARLKKQGEVYIKIQDKTGQWQTLSEDQVD